MTACTVTRYRPSDWFRAAALLDAWPFKPLSGHASWSAKGLARLCLARADNLLQKPESLAWVAQSADTASGFAVLRALHWDSEQIGLPAARLEYLIANDSYDNQICVKQALLNKVLQYGVETGIQHLTVRLDASDLSGVHVLENAGFIMVDGILTFALKLDTAPVAETNGNINIRLGTPVDSDAAAELACQAYLFDRFHADPVIPPERADELHATWLRNSCAGTAADAVVLAEDEQGLLGFVTCRLQADTKVHLGRLVGTIVMVATAKHARRRGIACSLTLAALNWFYHMGAEIVDVGTQLRNIPASRLYESCGFRLVGSSVSFRKLL